MEVNIAEIEAAAARLRSVTKPTPLTHSSTLSRMLGAEVWIKPENLQKTGSFKIRGAYNRIRALEPAQARHGVIAASAGNHGQALAFAATQAGIKATIVMPETASIAKVQATRGYGQEVVLHGVDYQAARQRAAEISASGGPSFIDAYDDPWVIAGQGSIGLEIAAEVDANVVMVPVGGGGLIAGIVQALAARAPAAEVIGVEAAGSPQLSVSLARQAASGVPGPVETIADGLATGKLGELPYALLHGHLREVVSVDDFAIGEAVLLLLERMKLLAEGAGATALAGALKLGPALRGKRVVIVVSGGNIDINLLDRMIGHGLVKSGRLWRFSVKLADRPSELSRVLALIGSRGANIHAIDHERNQRDVALGAARVQVEVETRGPDHIAELREALQKNGYHLEN
ncbi:MAG TPA: threonine ammonia-lyase [Candidatus Binataceae bacterium]|nr:threonine ammonia-lyase [Candidatus Binataceae bacterium]